eukprot:tig00021014_g17091.t1
MSKKNAQDFAQDKNVGPRLLKIKIVSKDVADAQKKQKKEERQAEAAKKIKFKFGGGSAIASESRQEEPPPPPQPPPPPAKTPAEERRELQRKARLEARQKQLEQTREEARRIMEEEARVARKTGGRRTSQRRKRNASAMGNDSDSDYVPNEVGEDLADVDGMLSEDEDVVTSDDDDVVTGPRERTTRLKRKVKIKVRKPPKETLETLQRKALEAASKMDAVTFRGPVPLHELCLRSLVINMDDAMREQLLHLKIKPDYMKRIVRSMCMLNKMDDVMLAILAEKIQTHDDPAEAPLDLLDISGCRKVTTLGLQTFLQFAPQLKALHLNGCSEIVNDELVQLVASSCKSLTQFSIGKCFKVQVLEPLAGLPDLEGLDISWCHYVTDQQLEIVLENCPKLTRLSVAYCKRLSVQPFQKLSREATALDLSGLPLIPAEHVQWILEHVCGESLTFLFLEDFPTLNATLLDALGRFCRNLRALSIARPSADETFQQNRVQNPFALLQSIRGLQILNLRQCQFVGNSAVCSIASACRELEEVDLSNCPRMQDSAVEHFAKHCPNLRKVNLSWCRYLTVGSLRALATACKGLASLDLWGLERALISALRSEFPFLAIRG